MTSVCVPRSAVVLTSEDHMVMVASSLGNIVAALALLKPSSEGWAVARSMGVSVVVPPVIQCKLRELVGPVADDVLKLLMPLGINGNMPHDKVTIVMQQLNAAAAALHQARHSGLKVRLPYTLRSAIQARGHEGQELLALLEATC